MVIGVCDEAHWETLWFVTRLFFSKGVCDEAHWETLWFVTRLFFSKGVCDEAQWETLWFVTRLFFSKGVCDEAQWETLWFVTRLFFSNRFCAELNPDSSQNHVGILSICGGELLKPEPFEKPAFFTPNLLPATLLFVPSWIPAKHKQVVALAWLLMPKPQHNVKPMLWLCTVPVCAELDPF